MSWGENVSKNVNHILLAILVYWASITNKTFITEI